MSLHQWLGGRSSKQSGSTGSVLLRAGSLDELILGNVGKLEVKASLFGGLGDTIRR